MHYHLIVKGERVGVYRDQFSVETAAFITNLGCAAWGGPKVTTTACECGAGEGESAKPRAMDEAERAS